MYVLLQMDSRKYSHMLNKTHNILENESCSSAYF